jgi:hypothetical protein
LTRIASGCIATNSSKLSAMLPSTSALEKATARLAMPGFSFM